MKKIIVSMVGLFLFVGVANADVNAVTPSTNDINRTNGWAHVDQLSAGIGTTDLQFISTRGFYSCFEYRTDGDTSQASGDNYNPAVTDGLYPFYCQSNNSRTETITADEYVEVRMVFGAETDERFDWTRFDVVVLNDKDQCKKDGWKDFGSMFKNQGDCVSWLMSSDNAKGNKKGN